MLVVKNGKVLTEAGRFESLDILIREGKFAELGDASQWPAEPSIEAKGAYVLPGLIDAHAHCGGFSFSEESADDLNEMVKPATPEMEALYAIDPESPSFELCRQSGITSMAITPGSGNVVGGLACAIKSAGTGIAEMLIKEPLALKMALGGNPIGVYGSQKKRPMTRMGVAAVIREQLFRAQHYLVQQAAEDASKHPPYDQGMEHLTLVLKKRIPLKVHCEQFDMLSILRIAKDFDVRCTIEHAWGASDFYDDMEASEQLQGIIFGPIGVPLLPGEIGKIDIHALKELTRRQIPCALMTDGPILHPEMLMQQAGEAVRTGMDPVDALHLLGRNPAKILGIDDRVGSIAVGKDADLAIFDQMPSLVVDAKLCHCVINGRIVFEA